MRMFVATGVFVAMTALTSVVRADLLVCNNTSQNVYTDWIWAWQNLNAGCDAANEDGSSDSGWYFTPPGHCAVLASGCIDTNVFGTGNISWSRIHAVSDQGLVWSGGFDACSTNSVHNICTQFHDPVACDTGLVDMGFATFNFPFPTCNWIINLNY